MIEELPHLVKSLQFLSEPVIYAPFTPEQLIFGTPVKFTQCVESQANY